MSAPAPPNFSTQVLSGWMNDINASFVLQSGYLVFMSEHNPLTTEAILLILRCDGHIPYICLLA